MSHTDASVPNSHIRRRIAQLHAAAVSVASTGSTIHNESLQYPEPPKHSDNNEYKPCPFCSEPLHASRLDLTSKANVTYWRLVATAAVYLHETLTDVKSTHP
jgi:hypothetical protein